MEFGAAHRRRRDEHDRDVTIAWCTAAFERQRTLPTLPSVLAANRTVEQQTPERMRIMVGICAEAYGWKVRRITH